MGTLRLTEKMNKCMNNKTVLKEVISGIVKDCYWDYNIDEKDILNIVESGNMRAKQKLFSKIIYNSNDRLKALQIFAKESLKELFDSFSPSPVYNERYISRHILVLRNIFFKERNKIEELRWKKR